MNKVKVVIAGCTGRMGRALLEGVMQTDDLTLLAALDHAGSAHLGRDAGELMGITCGVKIAADVAAALKGADVLIDFTRPEGTLEHIAVCQKMGVNIVIGTTGFNAQQKASWRAAQKDRRGVCAQHERGCEPHL